MKELLETKRARAFLRFMEDEKPSTGEWEHIYASADFRRIWRMTKGPAVLLVNALVRSKSCAEIWFIEKLPDSPSQITKNTFQTPAECETFLMAKKAELEADGWRKEKLDD